MIQHAKAIQHVFFLSSAGGEHKSDEDSKPNNNNQAPKFLFCRDSDGTILVWSIAKKTFEGEIQISQTNQRESFYFKKCILTTEENERSKSNTPNRKNYIENSKASEQRGAGLIATLFKHHHQQGYLAFAKKNMFEYYSIPYPTTQVNYEEDSTGRPTFAPLKKILDLQPIEIPSNQKQITLEPLALSFVQENNRLCVLVFQQVIVIIDCLQKCVIKRLEQTRNFRITKNKIALTKNEFGEIKMIAGHIG